MAQVPTQMVLGSFGTTVSGSGSLAQSVRIALGTQLGAVPQQLDFGVDWQRVIDEPIQEARAVLTRDIHRAFAKWLAHLATLVSISVEPGDAGVLAARVSFRPVGSEITQSVEVRP